MEIFVFYERIKGKIFLARKGIPKNRRMSRCHFFTIACWHQMLETSFKRCFLIYFRPPSSIRKSKLGKDLAIENGLVSVCEKKVTSVI